MRTTKPQPLFAAILPRKVAIQIGAKHYFTGQACKRNHVANRLVSTCVCVVCSYFSQKSIESVRKKSEHYLKNKEVYLSRAKKRYEKNRIELIEKSCAYQKSNLVEISKRRKDRMQTDDLYAIKERVRCLIKESIRKMNFSKDSKTSEILGCSKTEFKKHIEKQFTKGMSWQNKGQWHLDHIVPISTAKNQEDVIRLNHFTNLRPLWGKENLIKSNNRTFLI